jgi:hypothetical protein
MSSVTYFTAEELLEGSRQFRKELKRKSIEEKYDEWVSWYHKRIERLMKDQVSKGLFSIELEIPFQPNSLDEKKGLVKLKKFVLSTLPGCTADFVDIEEEEDGEPQSWTKLEIYWS